jgi:hypothetical protein
MTARCLRRIAGEPDPGSTRHPRRWLPDRLPDRLPDHLPVFWRANQVARDRQTTEMARRVTPAGIYVHEYREWVSRGAI